MGTMSSLITSITSVYSTVYSGVEQRKHQSSASLAFVWGIHRGPVNSPHNWPVTRKIFPFDDVIMHFCGWFPKFQDQCHHEGFFTNWHFQAFRRASSGGLYRTGCRSRRRSCLSIWRNWVTLRIWWGRYTFSISSDLANMSISSSQWRHNGVSNRQRLDCLLSCLFRCRSKQLWKLCVTGLCEGNPPVTGGFPSDRANNAEGIKLLLILTPYYLETKLDIPPSSPWSKKKVSRWKCEDIVSRI